MYLIIAHLFNMNILQGVKYQELNKGQFIKGSNFNSVCIHHTAGSSISSSIAWWNQTPERIATTFAIDRDGTTYQLFPLDHWAYHLHVTAKANKVWSGYKKLNHDKTSIGIELANWGQLTPRNGKFYNYLNREVKDVIKLDKPYKGFQYWEPYTKEQIESLRKLLLTLVDLYDIPLKTDYKDIFEINKDALDMKPGIYSHTSYSTLKVDIFPDPKLLNMLNSLKSNQ